MPSIVRKLLICAAVDGLLLQPINTRNGSVEGNAVRLAYGTNTITRLDERVTDDHEGTSVEAHGVVGLLNLVSSSYLISITSREQVAQVYGKPIYAVKDVTLIPLSSQADAEHAIAAVAKSLKKGPTASGYESDDSDAGEETETASIAETSPTEDATALDPPSAGPLKKSTTFVKDVVQNKGNYGRFADRWFSKSGWKNSGMRRQGMTSEEDLTAEQKQDATESLPKEEQVTTSSETESKAEDNRNSESSGDESQDEASKAAKQKGIVESLTPRILRTARLYFSSSGFYFSYDYDLSASISRQPINQSSVPVWKRFDSVFFWNHSLAQPFADAGQHGFILPLLQGFVAQRAFSISKTEGGEKDVVSEAVTNNSDSIDAQKEVSDDPGKKDFLLTLISRRSVKRAGLRYLRRGIDDEGNVANYVETEQILSRQRWSPDQKVFSLVQVRGSIPLFFHQSPYSFKPLPITFGSENSNNTAFKKHFTSVIRRYGNVQCASLVDKHGTEKNIGEAYERTAKWLNDFGGVNGKNVGFEWFDFHTVCKGMRFDKVSILLNTLEGSLRTHGWTVRQNEKDVRQQNGVLRTNCMDCLDRTNVTQSAVASWALQQQLAEEGVVVDLQTDQNTFFYNGVWADNGDAISKQYAGTAALKGDFTRTRKRNWTGALSDFSLTLNRYYNNIFGDYFLQTCIDFFLGNAGPVVFDEFESNLMSQDYALDMRRVRQNAIDTCIKIVLEDPKEDLVGGWTLSCPHEANNLRSLPFEECVLLLTDAAVYFCRFEWTTEKVGSFERIDLSDIAEIWRGAYITSVLGPTNLDETKNVGFALRYQTNGNAIVRTNTRALHNEKSAEDENDGKTELEKQEQPEKEERRLLAFKALPPRASASKDDDHGAAVSEQELVKTICSEISRCMEKHARTSGGAVDTESGEVPSVQEKDIISVSDARKATGYIESIGYSLKKLVWS